MTFIIAAALSATISQITMDRSDRGSTMLDAASMTALAAMNHLVPIAHDEGVFIKLFFFLFFKKKKNKKNGL